METVFAVKSDPRPAESELRESLEMAVKDV
jgi:hypothetical protein